MLDAVAGNVLLCDQNDEAALARLLEQHDDIAAAIIEPTGANGGKLPIDPDFLHALRRLTAEHGVLLIFDEVVNGFRVAPGGAQEAYGIRPDLTTLAKILAGGLPGGAVTGRKDILDLLDFQVTKAARARKRSPIPAPSTPTRSPRRRGSRACGSSARATPARAPTAMARICAGGSTRSSRRSGCRGRPTAPSRRSSCSPTPNAPRSPRPGSTRCNIPPRSLKGERNAGVVHKLRLGMMVHGVDLSSHPGGVISATHGEAELEDTALALRQTVRMLKAEGEL